MRGKPERVAWVVLLSAFATFVVLAVSIPLAIGWNRRYAEDERMATVESLVGTVVVEQLVGSGPVPLGKGQSMAVPEGATIYADETSEAVVTFFDHSFMRMFSGSVVRLERLRSPRHAESDMATAAWLNLLSGRVRIGTALAGGAGLDFRTTTIYGDATLAEDGSYAVSVGDARTEVTSYRGYADVTASGVTVRVQPRQRTEILAAGAPAIPVDAARNLIANSEMSEPLTEWRIFNDQGTDGGEADGQAEMVIDEGREAIRISRTGGQGNHCETILEQTIDAQVPDPATSLIVRATVKVRYQGLSGGGYLASEYPLMIRVTYRDVYDSEAEWVQGFYYENPAGSPTTYGLEIPRDRWYLFESENLLETLPVGPYRIIQVRVYASGWDYESLVSDVSLIVE
jgi:hypothetical protein